MARISWLLAAVAVLFGLQLPLCAAACRHGAEASHARMATAAAHAGEPATPPCHGAPAEPAPGADPDPHAECACSHAPAAVVAECERSARAQALPAAAIDVATAPPALPVRTLAPAPHTDLPPPDLLLRKATLLL
jgi:hypothetical protein